MEVEIRTYGDVRDAVGTKTLTREVGDDATVGGVLAAMASEFEALDPETDFDRGSLLVVKNGRNVTLLEGRETPLADGDRLSLTRSPMPE